MNWLDDPTDLRAILTATTAQFGLGALLSWNRATGNANKNYFVITERGEFLLKLLLNHPLEESKLEPP